MSDPDPGADLDRADMARLGRGHHQALTDLMTRHAGRLRGCLIRLLQNEADAEDLAQETFVRVYEHRERFNPAHEFRSWLFAIAMNLVKDRFRWRSRHPESALKLPDSPGPMAGLDLRDPNASPAETALAGERAHAVRTAVSELPEDLRIPLVLSEFEDCSNQEIGALLDCSAKAVEMKLYRARQHLRRRLARLLATE